MTPQPPSTTHSLLATMEADLVAVLHTINFAKATEIVIAAEVSGGNAAVLDALSSRAPEFMSDPREVSLFRASISLARRLAS